MNIEEYKSEGYFLEKCVDDFKKLTGYNLKLKTSETTSKYFEINRSAYLMLKNQYGFGVKKTKSSFLNFIPFAERNKEKIHMYEYLVTI